MVYVYFESSSHSELVAVFDTEELYNASLAALSELAKDARMVVTESIRDAVTMQEIERLSTGSAMIRDHAEYESAKRHV